MTSYEVRVTYGDQAQVNFTGAEGLKVYNQILHKMDVRAMDGPVEQFIPYHAIRIAFVTATTTEDPKVEDAVCNETNS